MRYDLKDFIFFILIIFGIVSFCYAQPVNLLEIRDEYYISKFGPYKMPSVYFSHDIHANEYQIDCKSCHHIYKKGKNIWTPEDQEKTCTECHNKNKAEAINSYHMKCWGCHKRLKEVYPLADTPTNQCQKCHIKPSDVEKEKKRIQKKLEKKNKTLFKIIQNLKVKGFY
ncbi:cytochrome c3 family protein [Desulfonauticus submarinus]